MIFFSRRFLSVMVFGWCTGFFACCYGQSARLFTSDQGLSNSLINQIYQDKSGFIWIATEDGLNYFDGTRFTVFRNQPGDSTSLSSNYVHTLFEDSQHHFWIGTINGLQLFDRKTNSFHSFPIAIPGYNQVNLHVTAMIEDRHGMIWVCTSEHGVITINPITFQYNINASLNRKLSSLYLQTIFEDRNGFLWFGSEDSGITVFNPAINDVERSFFQYDWFRWLGNKQISAICEDSKGNVLIGSLNGGLGVYLRDENRFQLFGDPLKQRSDIEVKALMKDSGGNIWIGADGQGLKQLVNGEIVNYELSSAQMSLNKTKAHSLLEDNQGNIWVGLFQKGVVMIPHYTNNFEYFGFSHSPEYSIGNGCIMSILSGSDGLWAGTDGNGIFLIDPATRRTTQYFSDNGRLVGNTVMSILEDQNETLWIGTFLNGLFRFDRSKNLFVNVSHPENFDSNKIIALANDSHNHIWIGTYGEGVFCYDPYRNQFTNLSQLECDTLNQLSNSWVNALRFDRNQCLWIGNFKGVDCFDPATGKYLHFNKENGMLCDNVVYCILHDREGNCWVGTSNGLTFIDKGFRKTSFFYTTDGLPGNVINGMEEDANGNLWISTNSGLCRFNPSMKSFTNFYSFEGLQSNEFRRGAAFKAPDGKLYFGGINGITAFYPQNIGVKRELPNLCFTDFRIFNRSVKVGEKSGNITIIDRSLLEFPKVQLRYTDNVFSIEFIALEYTNPEKIVYRYLMEGFDQNWKSTDVKNRVVTYTNLNPGEYLFKVIASDNSGNAKEIRLPVVILPPWWLTWWALLSYFVVAATITLLIMKEIHARIRQNHQLLELQFMEQANEAKLQLFANISHEIRTPLTLVINPLEKLRQTETDTTKLSVYNLMYRNSMRILRLMNQIMDVRRIDKGQMKLHFQETDIISLIRDVMYSFSYLAETRKMDFRLVTDVNKLMVWIDPSNFDKILFNLISNAFKFTSEGGQILIFLNQWDDRCEIRIADNGIGIDQELQEKVFDRFFQVKTSKVNLGSGVGLHLTRKLVELHHGSIFVRQRQGGGAEFVVSLPMGSDHLENDEFAIAEAEDTTYKDAPEVIEEVEFSQAHTTRSKGKSSLLLAEDDDEIRNYLKSELDGSFHVLEASHGKSAWSIVTQTIPDIVISDVMMPEMSGLELCRKIKTNPNTKLVPVILLTARSKDEDIVDGLDHGADIYLTKPVSVDVLKSNVFRLLESRQAMKIKYSKEIDIHYDDVKVSSADEKLMAKIIAVVKKKMGDPDLNVENLSQEIGISRVHLHRKLKELTNLSPRDFLRAARLNQAAYLLMNNQVNVSEVAYKVGFSSPSYFTSCFKDQYGYNPTEFVEKFKSDPENPLFNPIKKGII